MTSIIVLCEWEVLHLPLSVTAGRPAFRKIKVTAKDIIVLSLYWV